MNLNSPLNQNVRKLSTSFLSDSSAHKTASNLLGRRDENKLNHPQSRVIKPEQERAKHSLNVDYSFYQGGTDANSPCGPPM